MEKILFYASVLLLASCTQKGNEADAYGHFEAVETVISAETGGKIVYMNLPEGSVIEEGQTVVIIDTSDWLLKKEQLEAQISAVESRRANIGAQIAVQKQQKDNLLTDKTRVENLLKEGAATQKQLDDINGALNLADKQVLATETQNLSVGAEAEVLRTQIEQIDESIKKCKIVNPFKGTVLVRFAEPYELTAPGKPLYKMASLSYLYLRAYISGSQLSQVKPGQKVTVQIDGPDNTIKALEGEVTWIAADAEFTPKIIQTREERLNLVYAIKVKTPNDGSLKIGMPGEVVFSSK